MKKNYKINSWFVFFLTVLFFLSAVTVSAQVIIDDDDDPEVLILNLDEDEQDLADEYLDIIEQLKEIIDDYKDYLSDIDNNKPCDNEINFRTFEEGLADGVYAEDIMILKDDIEVYIDNLEIIRKDFRTSKEVDARNCYRIARSLSRELSILNNLIDKNITNRFVQKLKNKEFQNYLKESILKFTEHFLSNEKMSELEEQLQKLEHELEAIDRIDEIEIPPLPNIPEIPEIPEIPKIPGLESRSRVTTRIDLDDDQEESGLAKVYSAVQTVSSFKIPVNINNPIGSVIIRGDNEKRVEAILNIEISSDSRLSEKKFVESSTLEILEEEDAYYVNIVLPKLTDPHTKILNSQLTVNLPSKNHVYCKSSFGPIDIANLLNGVTLEASYADITLNTIRGNVKLTNSMNPVELHDVVGNLEVTNTYSPIIIYDCNGQMDISNAYALISVQNSAGNIVLRNSGQTEIRDHNGNVDIDNSYGMVKVGNLYGDLKAYNIYSPIETKEIKGGVILGNSYSFITAAGIDGSLNAENRYGNIDARYLNGPINLNSENGNILVIIENPLRGASSLSTTSGIMNIVLDDRTDIFLKAQARGGEITSFYPMEITDKGNLLSGILKLGRGNDSLSVTGHNAKIIIDESR